MVDKKNIAEKLLCVDFSLLKSLKAENYALEIIKMVVKKIPSLLKITDTGHTVKLSFHNRRKPMKKNICLTALIIGVVIITSPFIVQADGRGPGGGGGGPHGGGGPAGGGGGGGPHWGGGPAGGGGGGGPHWGGGHAGGGGGGGPHGGGGAYWRGGPHRGGGPYWVGGPYWGWDGPYWGWNGGYFVIDTRPSFIVLPGYGFSVSVGTPYDIIYYDKIYYICNNNYWYSSPDYHGPWVVIEAEKLPDIIRKYRIDDIRKARDIEYQDKGNKDSNGHHNDINGSKQINDNYRDTHSK